MAKRILIGAREIAARRNTQNMGRAMATQHAEAIKKDKPLPPITIGGQTVERLEIDDDH